MAYRGRFQSKGFIFQWVEEMPMDQSGGTDERPRRMRVGAVELARGPATRVGMGAGRAARPLGRQAVDRLTAGAPSHGQPDHRGPKVVNGYKSLIISVSLGERPPPGVGVIVSHVTSIRRLCRQILRAARRGALSRTAAATVALDGRTHGRAVCGTTSCLRLSRLRKGTRCGTIMICNAKSSKPRAV
jgi:hypothetical protein